MGSLGLGKTHTAATEYPGATATLRPAPSIRSLWLENDVALACCFAVAACALHFLFNGQYGYFRDELYYAACGQRLAWGYVDQAPLIALIARITRALLGDSLRALRFFPAVASGIKILITAWFVRELGGHRFGQILAGTAMLFCPIYLTMDNFLSMNAFEPIFWMLCAALGLRIARTGNQRLWLLFGLVAGIGLLNKHSMLFFGLGFVLALLVTPERRVLRSPWLWAGAVISFVIFLPNLIWEIRNHWATIEILMNVDGAKNARVSWLAFIGQQALLVHPLATPICLAGLWYFLFSREGRPYRFLGWTYIFVLLEFLIFRGRIYYLAPIYPMYFAAGSVVIEAWITRHDAAWAKPSILVPLVVGGMVAAPLALPILPLDAAASYAHFWDVDRVKVEKQASGKLPQLFADMMGWQQQAEVVATAFASLPPEDRPKAAILADNFGEAGAIDYFGGALGLPHAISGHNNYYLWGPQQYTGEVVVAVGIPIERLRPLFAEIDPAATIKNDYAIPEENNLPVYICRKPRMTLQQAWPMLKFYG
jgi:4-amino-4-deoxy-L-arabinose transferase-like glycosyltransferase